MFLNSYGVSSISGEAWKALVLVGIEKFDIAFAEISPR
jgi:hypothetical protein